MLRLFRRHTLALSRGWHRSLSVSATRWQSRYTDNDAGDDVVHRSRNTPQQLGLSEPVSHGEEDSSNESHLDSSFSSEGGVHPQGKDSAMEAAASRLQQAWTRAGGNTDNGRGKSTKEAANRRVQESSHKYTSLRIYEVPDRMIEDDLRDLFKSYGKITDVKIDFVGRIRMGMVAFSKPGVVHEIMEAHEQRPLQFEGEVLRVRHGSMTRLNPPCKTIFCTNFNPDAAEAIEERLTHLFTPYAVPRQFNHVPRTNMVFIDFPTVDDARCIIARHELRPFRDQGGPVLRLNFNVKKPLGLPHNCLRILGYRGAPEELEHYFPTDDGGNHITEITSVADTEWGRPPRYFVTFESIQHATRALKAAEEDAETPYRASYGFRPR